MNKTVIILSGGMDSTTLLYDLYRKGHELQALSFNYGQKHARELTKAIISCNKLDIPHLIVPFGEELRFLVRNSTLTNPLAAIPEGHYEAPNMKATVVPNRNMIMLALATGYAISQECDSVAYAAHAGDHFIYPDCRPEFAHAMEQAMELCHFHPIALRAPYMHINKSDICEIGHQIGVPYEDTWTCYKGQEKPCTPGPNACGACNERAEAFAFVGQPDPLLKDGGL